MTPIEQAARAYVQAYRACEVTQQQYSRVQGETRARCENVRGCHANGDPGIRCYEREHRIANCPSCQEATEQDAEDERGVTGYKGPMDCDTGALPVV